MSTQYEIFEAAKHNNLRRVEELLDAGVDVNLVDYDNRSTPLHYAASNGSRQTMELLIRRGANINAQNKQGRTALHMLVSSRYDTVALFLIRLGADIHIPDKRNLSPRDLALGWFQEEMEKATKEKPDDVKEPEVVTLRNQAPEGPGSLQSEVLKIRLPNKGYKSIPVTSKDRATDLLKVMAEKLGYQKYHMYLEIIEVIRNEQRKLDPEEMLWPLQAKWPKILRGDGQLETQEHCYFLVDLKRTAPADAVERFQAALRTAQ